MLVPAGKVTRISPENSERCYIAVQNTNSVLSNNIYILFREAEKEIFLNHGFILGGYGVLEIQNPTSLLSKKHVYAYTSVVGGVDIRVIDV